MVDVGGREFRPFGRNQQSRSLVECLVFVIDYRQAVFAFIKSADIVGSLRIIGHNFCSRFQQPVNYNQGRRLANIIGIGFEGQAPQGKSLSAELTVEMLQ